LTKYGNTVGNNPAQIRDPRIRSGKHPNCSRSCSSSHFFLFPVFPAKTVYGRFIWYTVSVGTGISCSRLHPYLRGTAVGRLVGRCGFFESWAFRLWTATTWSVFFRARSSFICVLLFLKKGFSPLLGGPYGCPRHKLFWAKLCQMVQQNSFSPKSPPRLP
jgi:hypothetical protein